MNTSLERQLFDAGWDCKEDRPRDDFMDFLGRPIPAAQLPSPKSFSKRIAVDGLHAVFVSVRSDPRSACLDVTISFAADTLLSYAFGDVRCSLPPTAGVDRIEELAHDVAVACAKAIRPNDKESTR